jgi:hypothetical protein
MSPTVLAKVPASAANGDGVNWRCAEKLQGDHFRGLAKFMLDAAAPASHRNELLGIGR